MIKNLRCYALAAVVAAVASGASALTYEWSVDTGGVSGLGVITGKISGLTIGANDGNGLRLTVLRSSSGKALAGSWTFGGTSGGGDAFRVNANKEVVFADAMFIGTNADEFLYISDSAFKVVSPALATLPAGPAKSGKTEDGPAAATVEATNVETKFELIGKTPVPAGLPLLLSGLGVFAFARSRRRRG